MQGPNPPIRTPPQHTQNKRCRDLTPLVLLVLAECKAQTGFKSKKGAWAWPPEPLSYALGLGPLIPLNGF